MWTGWIHTKFSLAVAKGEGGKWVQERVAISFYAICKNLHIKKLEDQKKFWLDVQLLILDCDQTLHLVLILYILFHLGYVEIYFSKSGSQFASGSGAFDLPWREVILWTSESASRLPHCPFTSRSACCLPCGCFCFLNSPVCFLYL